MRKNRPWAAMVMQQVVEMSEYDDRDDDEVNPRFVSDWRDDYVAWASRRPRYDEVPCKC